MKNMIRSTAVAAALAVGSLMLTAAPAQADTDGCVTKAEFKKVRKGWKMTRVHRVFDTNGKQSWFTDAYPSLGIPAEQGREYRHCASKYSIVTVDFARKGGVWKVTRKSAYWF